MTSLLVWVLVFQTLDILPPSLTALGRHNRRRKFQRLYARMNRDSVPGWPRTDGTTAESSSGHTKADCHRSGLGATTIATGARRPSLARIGAGPEPIKALSVESGGLEPCRCSRPARDVTPTIAPTIFCSVRPRPSPCSWWACPALTSMCWPWSPPLPTSTNPARCPRCARLRGDRRETDARGRPERPSKWRG